MKDGIYIYIKKNIKYKIPIYIYNIYNEKNIFHFPRILIIIDKNSSVSIIEKYKNFKKKSLIFNVNDIYIKENSNLNYLKIQNEKKNNFIIDNTFFFQKKKTKCYINTFSLNNFFTKNYLYILQEGEKSKSILNGLFFGYNKQYIKNYTKINHNFPNCKSYELYKGIFKDKSKYYFNGEIFINKKSNKIDAFQKNNYILLSDKSKVKAIPKLNIYNDEVKCSHGCTLSNINESNLFYLQTRGLSKKKAKLIIIYSFIEENLFFLKKISFINFLKKKIKKIIEKFLL
ncbi:Fe-S cluster assembly protein SufD [Candidatus Shikimatogenerans silvanidophilus]|uniref:Fe-S cluster assembly protein SufD n=1 Tax=Candidatus Shikimatogenerans silvanidophilus TaxID=2782547 RepID=UPI001BA5A66A|nr:Fe-S cluster assembly protein SufD [Candidatus Shikimatogenerans silvanidophilus]